MPRDKAHPVRVKTVICYDKSKLQPATIDAIANARDGEFIPMNRDEFYGVMQLHIFEPEIRKMQQADEKERPRTGGESAHSPDQPPGSPPVPPAPPSSPLDDPITGG